MISFPSQLNGKNVLLEQNCQKRVRAITSKSNIKKLLAKGDIVRQISQGAESKTAKEKKEKRNLIKNVIKTIYFLAKKKQVVKNTCKETIEYLANLGFGIPYTSPPSVQNNS